MAEFKPQNVLQVDDRGGNAYMFFNVQHTYHASITSTVEIDQSAVGVAHIPSNGQTAVTATLDASGDTTNFQKTVTIPATSASGVYTICVRFAGSGAGIGSSKIDT